MNFIKGKIIQNPSLNTFINLFNHVLFFTNLWIISFNHILLFLNYYFPPVVKEQFYRPAAAWPEPFEMPIYLVLTVIFVLIMWVSNKLKLNFPFPFLLRFIFLCFLLALFISMLGKYPMVLEYYPYQPRVDKSIYTFALVAYLIFIIFLITESFVLEKILRKKLRFLLYGIIIFVIALLTFEPRFPFSAHEYGYFIGPIWEVVKGKTLFTDVHTDYGFYSTLFFALLYKLRLFQFSQLPVYVWILFIIQYFLSFYLIYKISKSLPIALLGLFSIITINYFSFFVLPMTITQYSAMRRVSSIFLLFLLWKHKRIDSPILLVLFSVFCFWIVDTGIAMLMALGLSFFYLFILKTFDLKRFIKSTFLLFTACIGFFLLIELLHVVFGYKPINPVDIFTSLKQHAGSGLTMLPLATNTYFWIVILIYFSSIIIVFKMKWESTISHVLIVCANLVLTNSLYFVGRSDNANLYDISILILLNLFIILGLLWQRIHSKPLKFAFVSLIFLTFTVFPAYSRQYHLTEFLLEKTTRLTQGDIFAPEMDSIVKNNLAKDATLINKYIHTEDALILSKEDTYLLTLSGKKGLLDVNPQSGIDTVSEMAFATKQTLQQCPRLIAGDCRLFNKCQNYESLSSKSLFMAPNILETIQKGCNTHYKSLICTNHLCIAEAVTQ